MNSFPLLAPAAVPNAGDRQGGGPESSPRADELTADTATAVSPPIFCDSGGGGYRVDTAADLDWLEREFGLLPGQNWES